MHSASAKIIGAVDGEAAARLAPCEPRPASGGIGEVRVIRSGRASVVSRAFATSPLRLLTPRNHGHAAWVFAGTYGGGFVDGDSVHLSIDVGVGAAALLSTQASTKVYRSPRGTSASLRAMVSDGGLLVILPDPVVCFAHSRYRQTQRLDLGYDASLALVDWMSSGRRASGERWEFDAYSSRVTVLSGGRVVLADAMLLCSEHGDLRSRIGRFNVLCTIVLLGPLVRRQAQEIIRRAATLPIGRRPDVLVSASPIEDTGSIIRVAGTTFEAVAGEVRNVLDFLPALLGDDPWKRKW